MSKPSKNIPMPMSHMIRRWNEETGSRSRRAPALAVTTSLFRLREQGHTADRQGFNSQSAVLVKGVLLGCLEEFLAASRGSRIELTDTLDDNIRVADQAVGRADLRNEADLQRALRVDRIAEQDEGKRKARQRVFAQVGHDGRRSQTRTHLREP